MAIGGYWAGKKEVIFMLRSLIAKKLAAIVTKIFCGLLGIMGLIKEAFHYLRPTKKIINEPSRIPS
jgi:hypothetical protein